MASTPIRLLGLLIAGLLWTSACVEEAGQDCAKEGGRKTTERDCCEGLSSDFTATCVPCIPQGESVWVDGPSCCEGLQPGEDDGVCEPPSEDTGGETGQDTENETGQSTDGETGQETEGAGGTEATDGTGSGGSSGGSTGEEL